MKRIIRKDFETFSKDITIMEEDRNEAVKLEYSHMLIDSDNQVEYVYNVWLDFKRYELIKYEKRPKTFYIQMNYKRFIYMYNDCEVVGHEIIKYPNVGDLKMNNGNIDIQLKKELYEIYEDELDEIMGVRDVFLAIMIILLSLIIIPNIC